MNIYICVLSVRARIYIYLIIHIYTRSARGCILAPRFTSLFFFSFAPLTNASGERDLDSLWPPIRIFRFLSNVECLSINNDRNTYIAFQTYDACGTRRTKSYKCLIQVINTINLNTLHDLFDTSPRSFFFLSIGNCICNFFRWLSSMCTPRSRDQALRALLSSRELDFGYTTRCCLGQAIIIICNT